MTVNSDQKGSPEPESKSDPGQAVRQPSGSNGRRREGAGKASLYGLHRNGLHRKNGSKNNGNGQRQVYAALDLGTNNCRLLIAKPVHGGFRVIDAFSKIVRLGEGLNASGALSVEAMDRAVDALSSCAEKIERREVTKLRSVATEACRVAGNSAEFVTRVFETTGLALDVISAGEEARLAVSGCLALLEPVYDHAVVFDIGGGSTEVIWAKLQKKGRNAAIEPRIKDWVSMPYGVVNLAETINTKNITEPVYDDIVRRVVDGLAGLRDNVELNEAVDRGKVQFIGTSGTVTTLMSVSLGLSAYDRSKVDGSWIGRDEIRDIARSIALMSASERAAHPCIGEERADLVVPGCAVFEAILNSWKMGKLRVADRGIREGVLRGLMRRDPLTNARSASRSPDAGEMRA